MKSLRESPALGGRAILPVRRDPIEGAGRRGSRNSAFIKREGAELSQFSEISLAARGSIGGLYSQSMMQSMYLVCRTNVARVKSSLKTKQSKGESSP